MASLFDFLSFPFAIWLYLLLAGVAVSDCIFSVLLGDSFSIHWYVSTSVKTTLLYLYLGMYLCCLDQLCVQALIGRIQFLDVPRLLCSQGISLFPLCSRDGPTILPGISALLSAWQRIVQAIYRNRRLLLEVS